MDRLERLANLVLVLLDTARPLSLQELADTIGGYPPDGAARRQAFERDKRTLREEGVPISVEPVGPGGPAGYRIRPEEYYLADLGLTREEQVALNLAVAGVHLDDASGRDVLLKLGIFGSGSTLAVAALPSLDALPVLHQALRDRATLAFTYRGRQRRVDPYGLAFRGGSWYLVGWDHSHGEARTYRVDRMQDEPEPGEAGSFEPPADLDLSAAVASEPWRLGEGRPEEALVAVDAVQAPAVVAELGEAAVVERRPDASVVVRLEVSNPPAFRTWVLGLLDHAEVVAPPALRQDLVDWVAAVAGVPAARP